MTDSPIHKSIKQKLKNISLVTGDNFNYLFIKLTLERFIARVEKSNYKNNLIFKGGYCLNNFIKIGRETSDIDFLIRSIDANIESVKNIFEEISNIFIDDGFLFSNIRVSVLPINKKYPGYRIDLDYSFGTSKNTIHIDTGVGYVVEPKLLKLDLIKNDKGSLFNKEVQILAYPPEFIFSEKFHASVFLGEINSRIKDYHDMFLLIESGILNDEYLKETIILTFSNRETNISLISEFSKNTITRFEKQWKQHLTNVSKDVRLILPDSFYDTFSRINKYLDINKII